MPVLDALCYQSGILEFFQPGVKRGANTRASGSGLGRGLARGVVVCQELEVYAEWGASLWVSFLVWEERPEHLVPMATGGEAQVDLTRRGVCQCECYVP